MRLFTSLFEAGVQRMARMGVGFALCLACMTNALAGPCDGVVSDTRVTRTVTQGGNVIDQGPVNLPDALQAQWRRQSVHISYAIEVPPCGGERMAVAIIRATAPYQISANGLPLTDVTAPPQMEKAAPSLMNGRKPAMFVLSQGVDKVQLDLATFATLHQGLVKVLVGPSSEVLGPYLQAQSALELDRLSVWLVLGLSLVCGLLWLIGGRQPVMGLFALCCFLFWVRTFLEGLGTVPLLSAMQAEQWRPLTVLWFSVCLIGVTLMLLQMWTSRMRNASFWVVGVGTFLLVSTLWHDTLGNHIRVVVYLLTLVGAVGLTILLWRKRAVLGPARSRIILCGFVLLTLALIHDIGMIAGPIAAGQTTSQLGLAALLVAYAYVSAEYVYRAIRTAESMAQVLQHEKELTRVTERSRFARELHDGLGAQLISTLRGVERNKLDRENLILSLQSSLDDLRLIMENAEGSLHLLGTLARWRYNWDGRLMALGLALKWDISDSVDGRQLPADQLLHLMRILQEAVANVIRHSRSDTLEVHATVADDTLNLLVQDEGVGMDAPSSATHSGRGLNNMAERAAQIQATLTVRGRSDGRAGTCVHLTLPLKQSSHGA
jgi:signal transduction histidine kinase